MIGKTSTRQLLESCGSPLKFARQMCHMLGLSDHRGRSYRDINENRCIRAPRENNKDLPRLSTKEFSLRDLAESIIGEDWQQQLNPDMMYRLAQADDASPVSLLEAGTNMVTGSAFSNINAFTAVVTGLLEIEVMEGWQNPKYIADELMPIHNTRMFAGRKVIGTTRMGDVAEVRTPGMPTKRAGFQERWILQPATVENALSCEVTQEAVYLDLTGEVLERANEVGDWLRWRKEIRVIDVFIGAVNSYQYKGTSYNTYISAGYFNNDLSSNDLVDYTNVNTVLLTFRDMLDVETGLRVQITPDKVLVNQDRLFTAQAIFGASEMEQRNVPGTLGSGSTNATPLTVRKFPNVVGNVVSSILTSPLVYQECVSATGLNLSATNAAAYWWMWDSKSPPFKYAQNWPFRIQTAPPNQLDMIDRGVVLFTKADERGVPMVYEPRRIVRSHI